MNKNKQIEEIVNIMNNADPHYDCKDVRCADCEFFFIDKSCYAAKALYTAGYRKQSEGEWIEHEDDWCGTFYTCSVCKCDWTTIDGTPQENNMRYCPECGAKMRKEDKKR